MRLVTISLTCANTVEANDIVSALFEDNLVACVKQEPVNSTYRFKGKVESNEEVLLTIDTAEEKFREIEAVAKKLHSYHTPVLMAYPVINSSSGVKQWV